MPQTDSLLRNRYARQMVLPEVGVLGQEKLANASVLCVGAGGLGCPALLYLVAAGVGRIGIIDDDVVDESNLQRQILFSTAMVGQPKALMAQQRLLELNPQVKVIAYAERLTDSNCEMLFMDYDIIVDGTDNFSSKFLINDAGVKYGKPVIYGAIQGFEGQVSLLNAPLFGADDNAPKKRSACYRCLYPAPPTGHIPNCAEAGVIGAIAGMVGTVQAAQVIEYLVGHNSFAPLIGKLWMLDMKTMYNRILTLPKNPSCTVCSQPPHAIHLHYDAPLCATLQTVTVEDLRTMQDRVIILDVREQDEWNAGHIKGAIHHPLSRLTQNIMPPIPPNTPIVVHCQKQPRSEKATAILQNHDFTDIRILAGGFEAWVNNIS